MINRPRTTRTRSALLTIAAGIGLTAAMSFGGNSAHAGAATRTVQGIFGMAHGDPMGFRGPDMLETFVTNPANPSDFTSVIVPDELAARYGGVDALVNKQVSITVSTANPAAGGASGPARAATLTVGADVARGANLGLSSGQAGVSGTPTPVLTVLCRFRDKEVEPQNQSYFQGLAGPNSVMDSYWREASFGQVNLLGSQILPATGHWYVLPGNEADYLYKDENNKTKMTLGKLYTDCSAAAAKSVNLDNYTIINMAFNTNLVNYSFGGGLDGRRLTWLPLMGYTNAAYEAHEMGHAYHMVHSPYHAEYDNAWDVMSGATMACAPDPVYVCIPQHPSAYNLSRAGWLTNRSVDVPLNATTSVKLAPVSSAGNGTVLATISPDATHSYMVEYRRPTGSDANLPFGGASGAVIIYEILHLNGNNVLQLMGTDAKAGARWLVGDTFSRWQQQGIDEAMDWEYDGVLIHVDAMTATNASVTFTHLPAPTGLKPAGHTTSSYTITWNDPTTQETRFEVANWANPVDAKTLVSVNVPAGTTSHTFTNVPAGKSYLNLVRACNNVGCGPWSSQLSYGAASLNEVIVNP